MGIHGIFCLRFLSFYRILVTIWDRCRSKEIKKGINWKNDELTQTWGRFNRASAKDYEQQLKRVKSCGKNCGDTNAGQEHRINVILLLLILTSFLHA